MNVRALARNICVSGVAAALAATALTSADARIRPPVAMFASVARAAEFDPLANDSLRPTERTFVRQAIELSRASMRLAQLAVGHATSADIRAFAQQLVTDHGQVATSLDALARKKGVVLLPLNDEIAANFDRLSATAAPDFDKEFVRMASDLEEATVKIYEHALADAKDTDVKDLAGNFLPVARDHQNKIRDLRKSFE